MAELKMRGVRKSYGGVEVIKGVKALEPLGKTGTV